MNEEQEPYISRSTRERTERPGVFRESAGKINPNSLIAKRNATLRLKRGEQFRRAQETGGGGLDENTLDLSLSKGGGENFPSSVSATQRVASQRNAFPSRMRNYKPLEEEDSFPQKDRKIAGTITPKNNDETISDQETSTTRGGFWRSRGKKQQAQATQTPSSDKFPFGTVFLMLGTATFFWGFESLLDALPFVGWMISPIVGFMSSFIFFIWFKIKGVKFNKFKNIAVFGGSSIIAAIPIANFLPAQIAAVAWLIGKEKAKKYIPMAEKLDSLSKKAA